MTLETLHEQTLNYQSCSANEFATEALPGKCVFQPIVDGVSG